MSKQIHLGPKKSTLFATVDDEDYEKLVAMGKWHGRKKKRTYYARREVGGKNRHMHSVLMGDTPIGMVIDHIDGDGLNNQKNNLRFATFSQNANHRIRKRVGCTSEYRGVRQTANGRWTSRLKANGVRKALGTFSTEVEAAVAYDAAGVSLLGDFFKPNFPDGSPVSSGYGENVIQRSMAEGFYEWGFR